MVEEKRKCKECGSDISHKKFSAMFCHRKCNTKYWSGSRRALYHKEYNLKRYDKRKKEVRLLLDDFTKYFTSEPVKIREDIRENFKGYRKMLGMVRSELAREIGCSATLIQSVEQGDREPKEWLLIGFERLIFYKKMFKLCKLLVEKEEKIERIRRMQ